MKKHNTLLAAALLIFTGCGCWFVPCDRIVDIVGHVLDRQGQPVAGATVEFFSVTRQTCPDGCFSFSWHVVPAYRIRVTKAGYKPYEGGQPLGNYNIKVSLAEEGSAAVSTAEWRVSEDRLREFVCYGAGCGSE